MRRFVVSEMIKLPLNIEKGGRCLNVKGAREILAQHGDFTEAYGCYVFGIRAGRGYKPVYVGKATEKFLGKEALDTDKIRKINQALLKNRKGTLVVAFVVPEKKRGAKPTTLIDEIEYVLIQYAYEKNPQIENKYDIFRCGWCIDGVKNHGPGHPSEDSIEFRRLIGITNQKAQTPHAAMKKKQKKACPKGRKGK